MKRRSVSEWQTLFTEHAASGMTMAAFCGERGINPNYFSLRRTQLASSAPATSPTASVFVPVALPAASAVCVDILLAGTLQVRVPVSVTPTWLAALVCALRG